MSRCRQYNHCQKVYNICSAIINAFWIIILEGCVSNKKNYVSLHNIMDSIATFILVGALSNSFVYHRKTQFDNMLLLIERDVELAAEWKLYT